MKKTGPSLDWCVVRLGDKENWWVDSISDKENWDVDDLSIIDPKQFLHISELLDSMTEFGLDSQFVDEAFFTFEISEELNGGLIKLVRVRDSLLKAEDMLFALPDVLDEEKGPYADFLSHVSKIRVSMLNDLIDFAEPYTLEEMEEVLSEKQNNDFLESQRSHFSDELIAILEFVPDGFVIDSDLDEEGTGSKKDGEDYSDLEADLVEVSDKEEKLLPDEDLKWEEEEEKEETTPYEGGAPDEQD
ncbi:MAG: hypothetical protein CBC00_09255 [Verrucomicrobia bacterium TMED40]|nr:MAG: hypothetical protein CBC00_09255 [Verrucomicrobia bacterium TMED40]